MKNILAKLFSGKERPIYKWLSYTFWGLAVLSVLSVAIIFIKISKTDLPSFEDLENPKYDLASIVYSANNIPFGKYYVENREPINFSELSPEIVNALISTEDERFFSHSGVDAKAFLRVIFKTILMGNESSGGGSTITQQLSKLLFERPNLKGKSKIGRFLALVKVKLKEWLTAIKLEKSYTKEEIIAMYLNKFEFIYGAHGIQAAAQTYFDKDQSELSSDEAATLVGMLKNPSLYNPIRFPDQTIKRRNVVLSQMKKHNYITSEAFDTLSQLSLDMSHFKRETQSDGIAPYFRSELTKWLRDLFKKDDIQKEDGTAYNIFTDGLKIYTTIDLGYQKAAEAAVREHMQDIQQRYWRVWKGMNPWTFESDDYQRELRRDALRRRIINSDRYGFLFEKMLGKDFEILQEKVDDIPLSPRVLDGLYRVGLKKSSFNRLREAFVVNDKYISDYREFMNTNTWKSFEKKYETFYKAYEEEFNKEIPMQVFAYNELGEEEKTMSPVDSVKYHMRHLQTGMMSVDPQTGHIKAWVGGIGHKYFKFDHVNSRRQVGSTFKPFVYATAIAMQGISPCQEFEDIQYSIAPGDSGFDLDTEWSPSNANGKFTGNRYNLYQGLLYSKNSITVRLVKELGNVEVVRDLVENMGIDKSLIPSSPSICLGAADLSVKEMAGAYTTFSNDGIYTEPIFISRIEDKNGKVIFRNSPTRKVAINPSYNRVMVDMLKNNVLGRFAIAGIKSDVGGKTGTTNDYSDGWFMGITPNLVTATWVGGDEKFIRFFTLEDGQGFVMARPIFEKYLLKVENDPTLGYDSSLKFKLPEGQYRNFVDCNRYKQIKPEEEQNRTNLRNSRKDEFEEDGEEEFEEDGEY